MEIPSRLDFTTSGMKGSFNFDAEGYQAAMDNYIDFLNDPGNSLFRLAKPKLSDFKKRQLFRGGQIIFDTEAYKDALQRYEEREEKQESSGGPDFEVGGVGGSDFEVSSDVGSTPPAREGSIDDYELIQDEDRVGMPVIGIRPPYRPPAQGSAPVRSDYANYSDYERDYQMYADTTQERNKYFRSPEGRADFAKDISKMAVGLKEPDLAFDFNKDGKITTADSLAFVKGAGDHPGIMSIQKKEKPFQSKFDPNKSPFPEYDAPVGFQEGGAAMPPDSLRILKMATGQLEPDLAFGDINQDGKITSADALMRLKIDRGILDDPRGPAPDPIVSSPSPMEPAPPPTPMPTPMPEPAPMPTPMPEPAPMPTPMPEPAPMPQPDPVEVKPPVYRNPFEFGSANPQPIFPSLPQGQSTGRSYGGIGTLQSAPSFSDNKGSAVDGEIGFGPARPPSPPMRQQVANPFMNPFINQLNNPGLSNPVSFANPFMQGIGSFVKPGPF
jgi:hypothetical protein